MMRDSQTHNRTGPGRPVTRGTLTLCELVSIVRGLLRGVSDA
jgi:hypothetical protein